MENSGRKKNNHAVQSKFSKFASLSFDQEFQMIILLRSLASVPEPIGTPSDGVLHGSNYCLLFQWTWELLYQNGCC